MLRKREHAPTRLEGSRPAGRGIGLQISIGRATGGSRQRLQVTQFYWYAFRTRGNRGLQGENPHLGPFPGAACCKLIELPACKAAPLQADAGTKPSLPGLQ